MSEKTVKFIFLAAISLFSFFTRLLPHPPNFTPVGALFLFSGVHSRKHLLFFPLLIMAASDFFIGFYDIKLMAAVYASFILMSIIGLFVKKNKDPVTITTSVLLGSFLFFLITNFAVWHFSSWYPKNFAGLMLSYTLALPFFRNSLTGDLLYTFLFFGFYEVIFNKNIHYYLNKRLTLAKRIITPRV